MLQGYKTLLGLAIAAVPTVASLFGYDVAPGFGEQAAEVIDAAIAIVGLAIAFYGRVRAVTPGWFARKAE